MRHLLAALFLTCAVSSGAAENGKLGLGFVAGVPFGVTAKYRLEGPYSVQSHLGVSDGDFTWNADFLKDFDGILPRKKPGMRVPLYAGVGLKVKTETDAFVGVRFVGGVSLYDSKRPFELFAEVAPVLRLAPSEGGAFDGAVGVRHYF